MAQNRKLDPASTVAAGSGCAPEEAHPLLDSQLAENQPELYRVLYRAYQQIRDDDQAYQAFLDRMLHPAGRSRPLDASSVEAAYYLNEASHYVASLADLLPRRRRLRFRPLQKVAACNDMRRLLAMMFDVGARRRSFEAQRKIYLGKLFFDVDHTWEVQRGALHRDFLEELIRRRLFQHVVDERDVDIAFNIAADGLAIDYQVGRSLPEQEGWRFHQRELKLPAGRRSVKVHIFFYSCRSKREVLPYRYVRGQRVHELRTVEKWSQLSLRRDASIISKMLRTGISDPGAIPDIVGIMFIVESVTEVDYLRAALLDILGGPLRVRAVVDTLTRQNSNAAFNPFSGAGYKVYKAEIDMLYDGGDAATSPYSFAVELQIYTLESYLRTIHTRHYANHQRMKRRQFIDGLAPLLFPRTIYGEAPTSGA